jgi:hypothetical protein
MLMKPGQTPPRSPAAVHKWADEHRVQIWEMIEKLGKGEVSHKEARDLLREEKKALSAVGKRMSGFKTNPASKLKATHSTSPFAKTPKGKKSAMPKASAPPHM